MLWAFLIYVFVLSAHPDRHGQMFHHWSSIVPVMGAAAVAFYLMARAMARQACRRLRVPGAQTGRIRLRFRGRMSLLIIALLAAGRFSISTLGFGQILFYHTPLGHWPFLLQWSYILPVLATMALIWRGVYTFDTAWRHYCDTQRMAMGQRIFPWGSAGRYVWRNVRLVGSICLSLTVFSAVYGWVVDALAGQSIGGMPVLHPVVMASLICLPVFWIFYPYLLVRSMTTSPLPPGPLRDRLIAAARSHRVRINDIRIIHTFHSVANAAWIGTLLPPRYILLTDRVVDDFPADQVEDIFAHEVGHGYHRHATWYLLMLLSIIFLFQLIQIGLQNGPGVDNSAQPLGVFVLMFILILIFGKLSRISEYQADWFAARHWAKRSGEPCPPVVGPPGTDAAPSPTAALVSGAELGSAALKTLADVNRMRTDRTGLTHPSIDDRISSLYTLATRPLAQNRLGRTARYWRMAIALALVLEIVALIYFSTRKP